jgi:hypothetical protein
LAQPLKGEGLGVSTVAHRRPMRTVGSERTNGGTLDHDAASSPTLASTSNAWHVNQLQGQIITVKKGLVNSELKFEGSQLQLPTPLIRGKSHQSAQISHALRIMVNV